MTRFKQRLPYLLSYIIAFVFGMKQLQHPGTWMHLAAGKWILANGHIPTRDTLSYTNAGNTWVNVSWLFDLLVAGLEKIASTGGIILLQALTNVATLYFLFRTLKLISDQLKVHVSDFVAAFSALLFLVLTEYSMTGQSQMVSQLLCVVYIFALWKYPAIELKKVWWLVLLQCIWANMDSGYVIGILIIGVSIIANLLTYTFKKENTYIKQSSRASLLFVAAIVATILNPNGVKLWTSYFQDAPNRFGSVFYSIANTDYWTWEAKCHVALFTIVLLFWIFRLITSRNTENKATQSSIVLSHLLLVMVLGSLSLIASNNIPYAQIMLYPATGLMLQWLAEKAGISSRKAFQPFTQQSTLILAVPVCILYVSIVNNSYYKAVRSENRYGVAINKFHTSVGATNFIHEHNIKGNAFTDYEVSPYLLASLNPAFKSYFDPRGSHVFPKKFIADYLAIEKNVAEFDSLNAKYNFNYLVFGKNQFRLLQNHIYWGEEYNLVYVDPVATVYLKNDEKNYQFNHKTEIIQLFNWPQSPENPAWAILLTKLLNPFSTLYDEDENEKDKAVLAAKYYNALQNFPLSVRIMSPVESEFGEDAEAYGTFGLSLLGFSNMSDNPEERNRKIDSAKQLLEHAIQLNPQLPQPYSSLADMSMMKGEFELAKKYYDQSLDIDNKSYQINFNAALASFYLYKKTNDATYRRHLIKCMKRAQELSPEYRRTYVYLANAYWREGNTSEAKKNLREAIAMSDRMYPDEEAMLEELKKALK